MAADGEDLLDAAEAETAHEPEKYTLKVRRFKPESGEGPYWEEFDVELDPTLSVLDGLLQAKDREDGSLAVRCSCRAAICGSCGVKINGQSTLACKTQIGEAARVREPRNAGPRPQPRGEDAAERASVRRSWSSRWGTCR